MVQAAGRILEIGGGTDIPGDAGTAACGRIVEHVLNHHRLQYISVNDDYLTVRTYLDMLRNMIMRVCRTFIVLIVAITAFGAVWAGHWPPVVASSGRHIRAINPARFSPRVVKAGFAAIMTSSSPAHRHGCCFFCNHRTGLLAVCSPSSLRDHKSRGRIMVETKSVRAHFRLTNYCHSHKIDPLHPRIASSLLELGCALII